MKNILILVFLFTTMFSDAAVYTNASGVTLNYITNTGYTLTPENVLSLYQMIKDVDELFCKYRIEYWAIGGTLLGAVRNHGIIPWDHEPDIDIGVHEDQSQKLLDLQWLLEKMGYVLKPVYFGYKIHKKDREGLFPFIDIFIFNTVGDKFTYNMYGRNYFLTSELYPITRLKFGDYYINCPANSIPYLDSYYSNWQTEGWLFVGGEQYSINFKLIGKDYLPAMPTGPLQDHIGLLEK